MKLFRYMEFIKESVEVKYSIPSYEEAVEMCSKPDAAFYESKNLLIMRNTKTFKFLFNFYQSKLNIIYFHLSLLLRSHSN